MTDDPHREQPVLHRGVPLAEARATVVLIHGRGATAQSILGLADALGDEGLACLAPQAAGRTWYPRSFMAPIKSNEPSLTSALRKVGAVVDRAADTVPTERLVLLGFSQGACLGTEYAARHARRYGGVIALSGGLIGPEGTPFEYEGTLGGTPVFLGCSDRDPHIPVERVHETADVMEQLEGAVTERIYEGMGHTVNDDEIAFVRQLVQDLVRSEA